MHVAVIDAGGANLGSVCYALERLGIVPRIVRDAADLVDADRVILPGVGTAPAAMARLHAQGLVEPLRSLRVPLLGICLGMQLLYEASEEGEVSCLGLLPGKVLRMRPGPGARVPHMGWNTLGDVQDMPLLAGIGNGDAAYFVHGYAAPVGADTVATATHDTAFSAVAQRGWFHGAQFHPERSASVGARLLQNFIRWQA
jgi:glutamine amidotransferase